MNDELNSFIANYRNELDRQRDLGMQNLDNNRRNQFQNLMGSANSAGMMYSNFPERAKMQYDTSTYLPSKIKLQQSYQTGLDKLRSNTTNYINQLASINEAISDLNETNTRASLPKSAVALNEAGDYYYKDLGGGSQFRNASNSPVSGAVINFWLSPAKIPRATPLPSEVSFGATVTPSRYKDDDAV